MANTHNQNQDNHTVAEIAIAYVSNNPCQIDDLPKLMNKIREGLAGSDEMVGEFDDNPFITRSQIGQPVQWKGIPVPRPLTKREIERSIQPDEIICFENDRGYKSLKRGLATLGLTVEEYKTKWGLPKDYPMVAPNYSAARSKLAKQLGLGKRTI